MSLSKQALAALLLSVTGTSAAPAPQASSSAGESFKANPDVGPGGSSYKDSNHFRLYGSAEGGSDAVFSMMEAAYSCFVDDMGFTTSGLSTLDDPDQSPTLYKENIYATDGLSGGAAGVLQSDPTLGLSWLEVLPQSAAEPSVLVHEYGHGLTYHSRTWVDQTATGAWWETIAQWFADTYITSSLCQKARSNHNQEAGNSIIELNKVIGDSYQVIVDGSTDSGNYYQAWPFFTYLTTNPDNYTGLGQDTVRQLFKQYKEGSNETPLHTLARVSTDASVAEIVGSYWAHMAYVDIDNKAAQEAFFTQRRDLNYDNVQSSGDGSYTVKAARQPQYMGANILPLTTSGAGTVEVTVTSSGTFTATLAVYHSESGAVRYVSLKNGKGSADLTANEEASLVVANTPEKVIQYDGFKLTDEVTKGLDYTVKITGATI